MTDYRHEISSEAEAAVKAFILEYREQLSTPGHIGQYMTWLGTPTTPGKKIQPTPPFLWKGWKGNGEKRWVCLGFRLHPVADSLDCVTRACFVMN